MVKRLLLTSLIFSSIPALGFSVTASPATEVKTKAADASANAAATPSALGSTTSHLDPADVKTAAAQAPDYLSLPEEHPYVVARELLAKYEGMKVRAVDYHLESGLVTVLAERDMSDWKKAITYCLVRHHDAYNEDGPSANFVVSAASQKYALSDRQRAFIEGIVAAPRGVFDFVCETGQRVQAAQSTALASLQWRRGIEGAFPKPLISIITQYTQEPVPFGLSVAQIMEDPAARAIGAYSDLFNPEARVLNLSRGMIKSCEGLDLNGPVTTLVLDHNPIHTISVAQLPHGLEVLQFDSQREMAFDNGDGVITRPQVVEISASQLRRDSNVLQAMSRCFPHVRTLRFGHSSYQYSPQMLEWFPDLETLTFPQKLIKPLADRKKARQAREAQVHAKK